MIKIKILSKFDYSTFPITERMILVDESVLKEIGITKCFDVDKNIVIDYDNSQDLLEKQNEQRRIEIQTRLNELSQDFVQVLAGAEFDDIEERKAEFQRLHNELRGLLGKEPRIYLTSNQ